MTFLLGQLITWPDHMTSCGFCFMFTGTGIADHMTASAHRPLKWLLISYTLYIFVRVRVLHVNESRFSMLAHVLPELDNITLVQTGL